MLSAKAPAAQGNNVQAVFHRGSESGFHRYRETRAREIHPTLVRKSNRPPPVIRSLAWRASAAPVDSREVAHLMVYRGVSFQAGSDREGEIAKTHMLRGPDSIGQLQRLLFLWRKFLEQLGDRLVNQVQRFLLLFHVQLDCNSAGPDHLVRAAVNEVE